MEVTRVKGGLAEKERSAKEKRWEKINEKHCLGSKASAAPRKVIRLRVKQTARRHFC